MSSFSLWIYAFELKKENCFTIKSKDGVESIGPSAWILYIETLDVFPFLKDTVNTFFPSLSINSPNCILSLYLSPACVTECSSHKWTQWTQLCSRRRLVQQETQLAKHKALLLHISTKQDELNRRYASLQGTANPPQ